MSFAVTRPLARGGGIGAWGGSWMRIENNLIVENQTLSEDEGGGGGVFWLEETSVPVTLVGNTIVGNVSSRGSGILADGGSDDSIIANNIIVGTVGVSGIDCFSTNPIVRNNDVDVTDSDAFADACAGNAGINGNIVLDPIFMGAEDFRLGTGSPGIDAGDNTYVTETTDIRGLPRIVDGNHDGSAIVDLGAYERATTATLVTLGRAGH